MRKILLAALLLAPTVLFAASPATTFAGKWTLDQNQSQNLPRYYMNVTAHMLDVTQTAKDLKVGVEIHSTQHDTDKMSFDYPMDGNETKTETWVRTPDGPKAVPTVLKAEPQEDGTLRITISRELPMPNGEVIKGVTVETWELAKDGKTLKIHRADDSKRGKMEFDMTFVRAAA